jgi:hypothetical protein
VKAVPWAMSDAWTSINIPARRKILFFIGSRRTIIITTGGQIVEMDAA